MPAALTLILICPSPGSRSGTPAHFSTSGGPYPVITTALGIAVPSFLVAASGWPRTATSACSWCALSCSTDCALRRGRRFPAPLAGQISAACLRRADGRAGAAQQGQRAAGACGVVDDPADHVGGQHQRAEADQHGTPLQPGPMGLDGCPGDGVDDWVDVVALPQSVERREGDTACKCIFDGRIQHVYEYALEAS